MEMKDRNVMAEQHGQPRHGRTIGAGLATALVLATTLFGLLAACGSPTAPPPATTETASVPTPEVVATIVATPTEAMSETVTQTDPQTAAETGTTPDQPLADEESAYLVVQFDDTRSMARAINVTAPISGLAALQQSGLEVVTANFDWGVGVCSIEGVGCPAEDCFCGGDLFWNYSHWEDAAWQGYPTGPAATVISRAGSIEGWRWGEFETPGLPAPQALAAQRALGRLQATQGNESGPGSAGTYVETLMAVAANGLHASPALLDAILVDGAAYSRQGVAESGKLAVALAAVEACWPAEALRPQEYYSPTLGALSADAGFLAWGILGTLALDEATPADSVAYLAGLALPEGGWEWSPGWGRDTNTTALAIQTLIAAGTPVSTTEIVSGLAYLKAAQDASGGLRYDAGEGWQGAADANSTAYGLQALAAAGLSPYDPAWQMDGVGLVDFLLAVQQEDGGMAWQAGQEPNLAATQQAVPALLGRPFPLRRAALEVCR